MVIYVVKCKRVVQLQDISHIKPISITNRIRGGRVKGCMGKPKGLLQLLWERICMYTSKDVYTYYTLCR